MHILVIPSWYPTPEDPISGCFFREQAQALADFGHRVSVFAYFSDAPKGVYTEKSVSGNMTEYRIHVKPLRFHLTFFRIVKEMLRLLRTELSGARPDVIHVHSFRAIRYARAIRALRGIPIVCTEHATWFERKLLSPKELAAISRDYNAVDALIAVSPGLREHIQPYCTNKDVLVVPNMVDTQFLGGVLHRAAGENFGFVCVGALSKKKGIDLLLDAFAAVYEKLPYTRLTVCGGGEEENALRAQAKALGVSGAVEFKGQVSRGECAAALRENQAFVLPSRAETFGVVYVEAMACGLPVIMTKLGAWTILAREETGLAVDVESIEQLTAAMLDMAEHAERYDAETIRAFCAENFSAESVCRQLTKIYTNVTEKKGD